MSQLTTSVQADWCCRLSPCALQSTSWHRPPACWISALSCPPYGLNVVTKAVVKVVNFQRIWFHFKMFVSLLGNLACKKKKKSSCICMTGYISYPIIQIHQHLLSNDCIWPSSAQLFVVCSCGLLQTSHLNEEQQYSQAVNMHFFLIRYAVLCKVI